MKTRILLLLMLLTGIATVAQTTNNHDVYAFCYFKGNSADGLHLAYSTDGLKWQALHNDSSFLKPAVAQDRLMRDPCIIRGADGLFHMVWTVSWKDKGIGYASSKDLIHWSEQQFVPVIAKEQGARNTWAPEITYDARNKQYMIYWASTITGRYPNVDSTLEAGYNHRIYYVTTKNFKTFSDTQLLYDPGFNIIDATILPLGKKYIMFFKDETLKPVQKNLKIAYADRLTGPYQQSGDKITGNYWAEGPTALQIGKQWIVYFDKYRDHRYGAISSTDLKTWTDISDQIQLPSGIRHGTVFKITTAELQKLKALDH
ncbi:glycoside hydrolase family 43 protein [Mucilaginibacter daejeonensis]|uniref:glycoside hydrolase family 43 protein n=1 Tax=Mucilaginibacter daejeonensis TaxID=398049 RepID=UPI001D17211A|nr:glycoside hydrolase family 43 protein [Mucilaginibacter daejeonensis]UEG53057.1 glycoside hydrolase family 43 protein [Mucilaginibacter daejeonensis]